MTPKPERSKIPKGWTYPNGVFTEDYDLVMTPQQFIDAIVYARHDCDGQLPEDYAEAIQGNAVRFYAMYAHLDIEAPPSDVRGILVWLITLREIHWKANNEDRGMPPSGEKVNTTHKTSKVPHVDLRSWKSGNMRNLMLDLLIDELREGVPMKERRHGLGDATDLRRKLRKNHLDQVADAIVSVDGKVRTYKLTLSRDEITYDLPKT